MKTLKFSKSVYMESRTWLRTVAIRTSASVVAGRRDEEGSKLATELRKLGAEEIFVGAPQAQPSFDAPLYWLW